MKTAAQKAPLPPSSEEEFNLAWELFALAADRPLTDEDKAMAHEFWLSGRISALQYTNSTLRKIRGDRRRATDV